ncbi:MAG: HAD-IIIA family hydrolase, partial [Flavobacteriales bacterium]|nr:HAD-IIIA family hydrolase [Flavobacteriales bacterium]
LEALRTLAEKGYVFILITNQGGIAKGIYSHDAVNEIHNHLRKICLENGTPLTDIYYSPHHEITGLSLSRKPGSMMVERAIARYNINPAESWMIGDKQRDLDCASVLGVQGILIPTNGALMDYIHAIA